MNNKEKITFDEMTNILKNFRNLKQREQQLNFEVNNYKTVQISDNDMIETMMFNSDGERVKGGKKSDKTAVIALSYANKVKELNMKQKQELELELSNLQEQIKRIEFYISILDLDCACVLNDLYMDGLTFEETAVKEDISVTMVKNNRKIGIKQLVEMINSIIR